MPWLDISKPMKPMPPETDILWDEKMYPYLFWQVWVKFHLLHIEAQWWEEINFDSCFYAPAFHRMFLEILILGFHKYLLKIQVQENKDNL